MEGTARIWFTPQEERFPLYAFHLSRHVPPAKVRAFLDFVVGSVR